MGPFITLSTRKAAYILVYLSMLLFLDDDDEEDEDDDDDDKDDDDEDDDEDDDDDDDDNNQEGSEMDAEFNADTIEDSINLFHDDLDPFAADNDDNSKLSTFITYHCLSTSVAIQLNPKTKMLWLCGLNKLACGVECSARFFV